VLRIPAGTLLFVVGALVLLPLSWWSANKIVLTSEAVVLAVGARYTGALWSQRITARLKQGTPWYLDQSINLINDLALWAATSAVAWFVVGVVPLMLIFVLPPKGVGWGAVAWAFVMSAWYLHKIRRSRVRFLKVPLGLWVFVITLFILKVFQLQIIGTLEQGSIGWIAYAAFAPVVCAAFVEIVLLGTRRTTS
jgi:hypothetical protein